MRMSQLEFDMATARIEANRKPRQTILPVPVQDGPKREKELQREIAEYCRSRGWIIFHGSMAQATARTIGEPDFCILADGGRLFHVECKTPTGKLSPEQLGMHRWMEKLGHKAHVVRGLGEFIALVEARS